MLAEPEIRNRIKELSACLKGKMSYVEAYRIRGKIEAYYDVLQDQRDTK